MAQLLHEIDWGEPIFPAVRDDQWEAQVRSEVGMTMEALRQFAPVKWLRETVLTLPRITVKQMPVKYAWIAELVTAQENACRYCYGIARATMRIYGYPEKTIKRLERQLHMAELDDKDRTFIRFCRDLARSSPRPPRSDRDKLRSYGFSEKQVAEMTFFVAGNCFMNRVMTFTSSPPIRILETSSANFLTRLLRPLLKRQLSKTALSSIPLDNGDKSFSGIVNQLQELPGAGAINNALNGAFDSEILSDELKVLMFAVVAEALQCRFCHSESLKMATSLGFTEAEFNAALASLASPRLDADETKLLNWTRETVHYQTPDIQERVRNLSEEIESTKLLEAIGVAALANATVRIAVLLE